MRIARTRSAALRSLCTLALALAACGAPSGTTEGDSSRDAGSSESAVVVDVVPPDEGPDVEDAAAPDESAPDDVVIELDVQEPDAVEPDVVTQPDAPVDSPADAPRDTGTPVLRMPICATTEAPEGAIELTPVASTLVGTVVPVAGRVAVANPLSNPSTQDGEEMYRARNFHKYRRGPAQARVRRTDLGGPSSAPEESQRRSLAYFVAASDYQLTDDESPARFASTDTPYLASGLRPHEAYLGRAASAMNRTLAMLARPERRFDFGIFAGDCGDTGQLNELQWFMQLMNGERVHTDSGDDDDPVPGPDNDPKDPFTSVPFPAPWYYVPGNHDLMVTGVFLSTPERNRVAIGNDAATGTRDYSRWYAPVVTGTVVPDARRALVSRDDIVRELQAGPAMPGPVGHGFPAMSDTALGANYVADVVPNVLRVVALDTSDDTGGSSGLVHRPTVDRWLRPQLMRAQSEGVLVIVTSHHPIDDITRVRGEVGVINVSDAVEGEELGRIVAEFPNVIAWLVGHQHVVRVRPVRGAAAARPGFWEIQSGSIADWPGQARVVEIVDNGNDTLSIFGTMIDYDPTSCLERRFRRLQVMDLLSRWSGDLTGTNADRNVELVIPLPSAASDRLRAARMTAPARIESETTLRGMR